MKNKNLALLSAFLLMVIASMACVRLFRTVDPLEFEPDTLPASQLGAPYEAKIRITQNITPAGGISITKGDLPDGLEFVRIAGEDAVKISGTPEETGTFTFTVSVWCYGTNSNSGQTGEKEYNIVVEK